jgi:hypothetical protein
MQDIVTSVGTIRVEVTSKAGIQLAHWGGVGAIYATLTVSSSDYLCRGTAEYYPPDNEWSMETQNSVIVESGSIPSQAADVIIVEVMDAINQNVPLESELEESRRREILNRRHDNDLQIGKQESGRDEREIVRLQLDQELLS